MKNKPTRGKGLLEKFLAQKRANLANNFINENLRKGKILDIGCGTNPLFLVETKFKTKYGIDYSLKNIGFKKNLILKKIDIGKNTLLPFSNEFFDVITMLAVIEHINPKKIINIFKEIKRVLKFNGIFILTTPCPWSNKLIKFMAKLKLISQIEIKEHKNVYGCKLMMGLLKGAGFKRKKINFGYFELFLNSWFCVKK